MMRIYEEGKGRWFYSRGDGSRGQGPYVTEEKAMAAAESETPKPESKPIRFYDVSLEKMRDATQKDFDVLWSRAAKFSSHYPIKKIHMHIAIGLLFLIAVGVGRELNNFHHPVQLSFCADGPQGKL